MSIPDGTPVGSLENTVTTTGNKPAPAPQPTACEHGNRVGTPCDKCTEYILATQPYNYTTVVSDGSKWVPAPQQSARDKLQRAAERRATNFGGIMSSAYFISELVKFALAETADLRAEVARLREALQQIVRVIGTVKGRTIGNELAVAAIASAALTAPPSGQALPGKKE